MVGVSPNPLQGSASAAPTGPRSLFSRSHAFFEFELLFSFSFLMGRPRDIARFRDRSQIQVKCRPSTRLLDCSLVGLQRLEPSPSPLFCLAKRAIAPNSCTSFCHRPPLPCPCRLQLCSNAGDPERAQLRLFRHCSLCGMCGIYGHGPGREGSCGWEFRRRSAFATSRTHPLSINTPSI